MGNAKLDPTNPPILSAATIARLDAMTPDDIERNAREDADNPPMTEDELVRLRRGAWVRSVRRGLDMTQAAFADTYGIRVARLRDWEQGRFVPDEVSQAYLEAIRRHPQLMADAKIGIRENEADGRQEAVRLRAAGNMQAAAEHDLYADGLRDQIERVKDIVSGNR